MGRVKIRRRQEGVPDGVSPAFVQRAIMEMLEAYGVLTLPAWRGKVDHQLTVIRVVMHELQTAVGLAASLDGSARSKITELLAGMGAALTSAEEIMQSGDVPATHADDQREILRRVFGQADHEDPYGEDVETDDFEDPLDNMLG